MELTTTFASDISEIKERLHALDGKGEVEEDTEEHHEATPTVPQPVATTEEKHEEAPQPTAPVATDPTATPVAETTPVATPTAETTATPVTPVADTTVTPTAPETTVVPTTQGDDNHETNGKVEEHNAETTVSGNNING